MAPDCPCFAPVLPQQTNHAKKSTSVVLYGKAMFGRLRQSSHEPNMFREVQVLCLSMKYRLDRYPVSCQHRSEAGLHNASLEKNTPFFNGPSRMSFNQRSYPFINRVLAC